MKKRKIISIKRLSDGALFPISIDDEGNESIKFLPSGVRFFNGLSYSFDIYMVRKVSGAVVVYPADKYIAGWEDDE